MSLFEIFLSGADIADQFNLIQGEGTLLPGVNLALSGARNLFFISRDSSRKIACSES